MDQPEDVIQYLRIVRVLLEPDELIVDRIETLVSLGQEFAEEIIHSLLAFETPRRRDRAFHSGASFKAKR